MTINVEAHLYAPDEKRRLDIVNPPLALFSFTLELTQTTFRDVLRGVVNHPSGVIFHTQGNSVDYDEGRNTLLVYGNLPPENTLTVIKKLENAGVAFDKESCALYNFAN